MHTLLVSGAGVVLLGLFMLFGKLWGGTASSLALAAKAFIPIWLINAVATCGSV
jgi:hypothetical protein